MMNSTRSAKCDKITEVKKYPKAVVFMLALTVLMVGSDVTYAVGHIASEEDVESLYAHACTMLEDHTIRDVSAVPKMLEECAEVGHVPSRLMLLDVYEGKRKGIAPAPEKAFELARKMSEETSVVGESIEKSAEQAAGRSEAMYRLALYYEKGLGCKASPKEAFRIMRKAASTGLPKARVELARYLINGTGHEADYRQARALLRKIAESVPETPNTFFYLGYMYMNGYGMHAPNLRMARSLYELGQRVNDAKAINNLAAMYERGVGAPRDFSKALSLYKRAASLGCKDASANMQRLAYKATVRPDDTWRQRIGRAGLRVVYVLPVSKRMRRWLEIPLRHMETPTES